MSTVHVYPTADHVDHWVGGEDCVCGPDVEPVPGRDGAVGWLITHHSLDGRERREPDSPLYRPGPPDVPAP